jgi:hypothetical protein
MRQGSRDSETRPIAAADAEASAAALRRLRDRLEETREDLRPLVSAFAGSAAAGRRDFCRRLIERLRDIGDDAHAAARAVGDMLHSTR